MLVKYMGDYRVIVEGANTYSPDPIKKTLRQRMEQVVYQQKGVMIANDYLVNSGGVIFAAQEHVVPTPHHLQIPADRLGNRDAVQEWIEQNASELKALSNQRKESGETWREKAIRDNMIELVSLLSANAEMLPCQAAEEISLHRLSTKDQQRSVRDIMIPIATVSMKARLQEAAQKIVDSGRNLAAVVDEEDLIVGVINAWGIAKSLSRSAECADFTVQEVMTSPALMVKPSDVIPSVLVKLEENRISAMPVVEDGKVLGLINTDILASRYYLGKLLEIDI
jgi:glutamate dehydrogenase (NAD(P)+)